MWRLSACWCRCQCQCFSIVVVFIILGSAFNKGAFIEQCRTPYDKPGYCVVIDSCPEILQLVPLAANNSNILHFLRNSSCEFLGTDPKVCCSRSPAFRLPTIEGDQCGYSLKIQRNPPAKAAQVESGDWPWVAILGYRYSPFSRPRWYCGGALITTRHVLTAAHCVHYRNDLSLVRLGEVQLYDDKDNAIDMPIAKSLVHNAYSPYTLRNDIALLTLKQEVDITAFVRPICLPIQDDWSTQDFAQRDPLPYAVGWRTIFIGTPSSDRLLEAPLNIVSNNQCSSIYSRVVSRIQIDEKKICAGVYPKKSCGDVCLVDVGGPLMFPKITQNYGNRSYYNYHLIGILSYGYRCADSGFPSIFTRVQPFIPWIQSHVFL